MIRNSILFTLVAVFSLFTITAICQTTYVNNGTNTTYTLNAGDSLSITGGTFTGTINTWVTGSKITVSASAYFNPSSFNDNKSKVIVYGSATLPSLNTGAGFDLKNYGNLTVTGSAAMNAGAQTWTNYYGATMNFNGQLAINFDGSSLVNSGTVNAKSDFFLYAASTITNNNVILITGDFKTSKGQVNNGGKFYSAKGITISGSTTFTNSCRTVADKGILIDNPSSTVYNTGLLWASNVANNSYFTNSGTVVNGTGGRIKSVTFTNNGNITGTGSMYFTGVTTASGTIGVAGITTDSLRVFDASRTDGHIFDNQWGTIRPNVVYAALAAPDTTNAPYATCASVYISSSNIAVLPIKWNYFYATLINDVPVLNWSSEHDPGTQYEVERSYDNNHFYGIATIAAETNKTIYQYSDKQVDNNKSVVYYRIKGIGLSGEIKFTEIRAVKFTNAKTIAIQLSPNPFTSSFSINYDAVTRENLVVKIYNSMGQLNAVKSLQTNVGMNTMVITEASQFIKGIYIVEIANDQKVIATQKLLKQ